ncbi:MAG: PD-(D/E)XK nuclease family protein [Cyanobacteria bacterium P01_D01_bin.56]
MPAYGYSTFDAEVRGTLAQVKQSLHEGVLAQDIAIVARDEKAYGPKLIDVAWEYDIPFRALYDTPLLTTRLGAWLSLLLDVVETDFPFEATAKLLSHPLCSSPDADFWAVVRGQHPKGFGQWQDITEATLGLDLGLLSRVNQTRRRDTWVEWWWTLFRTFDLRQRCARWARESIAFNRLADALVELSRPEEELLTWSDFKQQFRELLEVLAVPAQPGRGGVELHCPASVAGARYAHVFLIGMAEGILPAPVQNDPDLDFFERRQLQAQGIMVAGAAALACQEGVSFYHLLQTVTETMTFSYAKLRDRQEQLASPYLKRLGLMLNAPPQLPVASLEELRRIKLRHGPSLKDPVLAKALFAYGVEQYRESSGPPDEYDGVVGIPFDYTQWCFSVSQLTQLGQCPFKWFASRLLQLDKADEAEEDLSPSLRGSLYHKVLELLIQALRMDSSLSLQDRNLLEEKFLEAEQVIELPELPAWSSRRKDHIQRLWQTIQQPEFLPDDAEPVSLEQRFEGEWLGLRVTGRVDRIDRTPGGLVLIDYKTSASVPKGVKDTKGKASIDIQLPLYKDVAASSLFPEEAVAETYYYSLTKGKKMTPSRNAPQHELPMVIEQCKDFLERGYYPVQPDIARAACQYCNFDWVCRQGNRLSNKENCHGAD